MNWSHAPKHLAFSDDISEWCRHVFLSFVCFTMNVEWIYLKMISMICPISVWITGNAVVNRPSNEIDIRTYPSHYLFTAASIWSLIAKFMGPSWGPPGSCRPRWAPCRPHDTCYQGYCIPSSRQNFMFSNWLFCGFVFPITQKIFEN